MPAVYVHGNPTHSDDWLPFLRRGGPARRHRPARLGALRPPAGASTTRCTASPPSSTAASTELGVGERDLVVHDWGALALIGAQRRPERVRRLVVINAVPLLPGYRWHRVARLWRRRGVGEALQQGRHAARPGPRAARGARRPRPMPDELVEMIWSCWDRGTADAVLQLYRDADPDRLAGRGRATSGASTARRWCSGGSATPTCRRASATPTRSALGNAEAEVVPGAGHWPWIEDPSVVDRVLGFLPSSVAASPSSIVEEPPPVPRRPLGASPHLYNASRVPCVRLHRSKLPKGYPDALRQIGLFVLADLCYETVRGIAEGNRAVAFANGAGGHRLRALDRHVLRARLPGASSSPSAGCSTSPTSCT